jgi:hypothetical protein
MKGYAIVHDRYLHHVYVLCIKTTTLTPISQPVVNPKYALYKSPKFTIEKILDGEKALREQQKKPQSEQIKEFYGVFQDEVWWITLQCRIQKTFDNLSIPIYKNLRILVKLNSRKTYGWTGRYLRNGSLKDKIFIKNGDIIKKKFLQNGERWIEYNFKKNTTIHRNLNGKLLCKLQGIVSYYESLQIRCISYFKIDYVNHGKETDFGWSGSIISKKWFKNDFERYIDFQIGRGINIWKNRKVISNRLCDLFIQIEYIIIRKKALRLF